MLLGLSDIGSDHQPEDYDKVDADDYVMHEDDEKIYFLIKSKSDEYCFTNTALIHLDGTSATSKKRVLKRYDYQHPISSSYASKPPVQLISISKSNSESGKKNIQSIYIRNISKKSKELYKALIKMSEINYDNAKKHSICKAKLELASTTLSKLRNTEGDLIQQFKDINQIAFSWLMNTINNIK